MQKKPLAKFSTYLWLKLFKNGHRRNPSQQIKAIYDKLTANIILSGEKLKAFPLRSEIRWGCSPLPLLFNIVLEVLATAIREVKEIKNPDWKRRSKAFTVCRWHDTVHRIDNTKDSIRKLLELISELSNVAGYKNHLHFYILTIKNQKEKLRNQSHSPLQQKELNILE